MSDTPTTDQGKRAWLLGGKPLIFDPPPTDKEETAQEEAARTIRAGSLEDLAAKHARVVAAPIVISNAIIAGPLNLQYATFEAELSITDCRFTDEADFSLATFKRSATFRGSCFKKAANFRAAHAHADFNIASTTFYAASTFMDLHVDEALSPTPATFIAADFQLIEVAKGAFFHHATFSGEAAFQGAHMHGDAEFGAAQFKGKATFDGIQIDSAAFFCSDKGGKSIQFEAEASFLGAHIQGAASFRGAQFKQATFDGIEIDGNAFFSSDDKGKPVQFEGEASFLGAHIHGAANFDGAQFKQATFDGIEIDGNAFFSSEDKAKPVQFEGEARFVAAHIHGQADFSGAQFNAGAGFDGIQIGGATFFRPARHEGKSIPVRFGGTASFSSAVFALSAEFSAVEFHGAAAFNNAHFQGATDFKDAFFGLPSGDEKLNELQKEEPNRKEASFKGAQFRRGVTFEGTTFEGPADFTAAIAERDARLPGAKFSGPSSFREARFQVVFLGEPLSPAPISTTQTTPPEKTISSSPGQPPAAPRRAWWRRRAKAPDLPNPTVFIGPLDLRGFTYDRIYVSWRELLGKLNEYDRQPFTQLEKAFRGVGEDRKADEVYLERRHVERQEKWRKEQYGFWFGDALFRLLAYYGVRPYRLLVFTALVLGFGLIVFSYPNAVTQKDAKLRASDPPYLNFWQAAGVSVNLFLPVEIPAGNRWAPTENPVPLLEGLRIPFVGRVPIPFTAYASLHRLAGWLLVPLGVAALSGLLHKRGKTDRG